MLVLTNKALQWLILMLQVSTLVTNTLSILTIYKKTTDMLHQGQPNQCGQSENTLPYIQLQPRPYKCSYELFRTMKKWRSVTIRPFRIFHSHQSWIIVCIGQLVIKFRHIMLVLVCSVLLNQTLHMGRYSSIRIQKGKRAITQLKNRIRSNNSTFKPRKTSKKIYMSMFFIVQCKLRNCQG